MPSGPAVCPDFASTSISIIEIRISFAFCASSFIFSSVNNDTTLLYQTLESFESAERVGIAPDAGAYAKAVGTSVEYSLGILQIDADVYRDSYAGQIFFEKFYILQCLG